jgi:protein TonB
LRFIQLNSPKPDAAADVAPLPQIEPPKPVVTPTPAPVPPAPAPAPAAAPSTAPQSGLGGTGTGSGTTGGPGAGPGSGGGTGSGIGTGTGSGTGPGTGGGPATNYPPQPTQLFLPPLPAPASLRGFHLIAWFDVDERGNAKLLSFNQSRDGGYNRKLREVLLALKFRPGTRPDGTPVRDTADIHFIF